MPEIVILRFHTYKQVLTKNPTIAYLSMKIVTGITNFWNL